MEVHSKINVLITGITGFTGVHLEKSLTQQGYAVYGTTLSTPTSKNHFKCNILEEDSLIDILNKIKFNYIIHLAAISFVAAKDQKSIYNVNIFGTLNLLNVVEKLKISPDKILIASSAAVYGNIDGELTEEMCPNPVNHYGNSKLVMENMVKQYFERLNIVIVRPFNYTGIGQDPNFLIPKIVSHFKLKKSHIELGNLNTFREYNDVKYVTDIYIELLKSTYKSGVINVSSGNTYSISEIIKLMEKIANYSIEVKVNPDFIRENEIKQLKGSTINLEKIITKKIEPFSIENTLKEMYTS